MPKVAIDYSKTIIYHFVCKDQMITCQYVGSTTNFNHRKGEHKSDCHLETSKHYHLKVYQTIRANGGWDNWSMVPLEEYPCENKMQKLIREQYWMDQLKPQMNSVNAIRSEETREEYMKGYYVENKEVLAQYNKAYREDNKVTLAEKTKAYREANFEVLAEKKKAYYRSNKEVVTEYHKAYRETNKVAITERKSRKVTCACGAVYSVSNKAQHERTIKHQKPTV